MPKHLQNYVTDQSTHNYSFENQATWYFVLYFLKQQLTKTAHPFYLEGMEKTGLTEFNIPSIPNLSKKLKNYGWTAVPVSGFLPPSIFMEFQSRNILPIASEMRTLEHILYTPAPDIVHEAAGHAPLLPFKEYSSYLEEYAQVANKAILSKEDMELYEAIRHLSDIKEHPNSTKQEILSAETNLAEATQNMSFTSEASYLGRMNWWTAEYGLIGTSDKDLRLYGAGLLSSLGESANCLLPKVEKKLLDISCLNYTYDITEQQPQLFYTPDFLHLKNILSEFSNTLSFKKGNQFGLAKALESKAVVTVLYEDKFTSGILTDYSFDQNKLTLIFKGPLQTGTIRNSKKPEVIETLDSDIFEVSLKSYDQIVSVYGGPYSTKDFPQFDHHPPKKVEASSLSNYNKLKEPIYKILLEAKRTQNYQVSDIADIEKRILSDFNDEWLLLGLALSLQKFNFKKEPLAFGPLKTMKPRLSIDHQTCVDYLLEDYENSTSN